ncbi:MAG: hypothetical protein KGK10_04140 [Rhodospirillales bacterium]|nr:hypothetical protein [Rhodospirillales bacterium]
MAKAGPETSLYAPVKRFLESLGFEAKGEINGCDVVGLRAQPDAEGDGPRGPEVVVAELKRGFTLELLLQAVDRTQLADEVWMAVPATRRAADKRALRLCRLLGLGLLSVGAHGGVAILVEPAPYQPRRNARRRSALVTEFRRRQGDPNPGGSTRKPIMTAYRQAALACAAALREGPLRPRDLRGVADNAPAILARNVYGWFRRERPGLYALAPAGHAALAAFPDKETAPWATAS